jgi:translation elongation factor EF-Ts
LRLQVDESVKEVASVVRENVVLRAAQAFASTGHIATYIHNTMGPSCGTMCSAVALENEALDLSHNPPARVVELGKQLAMQVCLTDSANPLRSWSWT